VVNPGRRDTAARSRADAPAPSREITAVPRHLCWLAAVYFAASLLHFSHNAEFVALYPNMPAWVRREDVYLVWAAISAMGLASVALWFVGWRLAAAGALALYGALGLDGLAHYTLALCSEHTLAMNLTIWLEAATGLTLALAAFSYAARRALTRGWRTTSE
jgi:hypothetical protein